MPTIEDRAKTIYEQVSMNGVRHYNIGMEHYIKGAKDQREVFLNAYCKTCCNLDRKKCLEFDGMCKQYAKLIKNMEG